ncbi:MAG: hypothetical protein RR413_09115 [Christensenellaceae bacterium]
MAKCTFPPTSFAILLRLSILSEGFEEENYRNFKNHFPFEAPSPKAEQKLTVYLMAAYLIHTAMHMAQREISKELDFICETNAAMQKPDGMKRLYLLDYKRIEYTFLFFCYNIWDLQIPCKKL